MRRPNRVGLERCVYVDRFRRSKRLGAVNSVRCLPSHRCPQAVTRGIWRHWKIGTTRPFDVFLHVRMKWLETKAALGPEGSRVRIANPPEKWRLRLGISGVVFPLQRGNGIDRVVGGNVAMNNAVAQTLGWLFFQRFHITVHHPIDRAIADCVRTYVNTRAV